MPIIDALIFDLDGTLVDSKISLLMSINFTLRKLKLKEKSFSEIRPYIGIGLQNLFSKLIEKKNRMLLEEALNIYNNYYSQHAFQYVSLYSQTYQILEHFKEKRKAIVTNRKINSAQAILEKLNISHFFETAIGGDNPLCLKPSACPINKVLKELNLKKEKTVIIGDMATDILAGKNSQVITCAVSSGIGTLEELQETNPDYLVADLLGLKELFV